MPERFGINGATVSTKGAANPVNFATEVTAALAPKKAKSLSDVDRVFSSSNFF